MRNLTFLIFVFLTFICWGLYGPLLHVGQELMGGGGHQKSLLRPLICVGFAYFLIAVVFPSIVLVTKGEKGFWSFGGFAWSFFAGAVGAVGALGIILAFKFGGKPFYVMPLVFGLAPIINTFVTMAMARTFKQASIPFYIAILIVAVGAAGVLITKPGKVKADPPKVVASLDSSDAAGADADADPDTPEAVAAEPASDGEIVSTPDTENQESQSWPLAIALSVALTVLCWGAYGPVLHKGQLKMGGSRLRPFFCVGLAYFAIAVVVPIMLLDSIQDPGSFESISGILWSVGAGATGALGALGIIYAFNFGGKPIFIMPLVFGFAPVVNTFYSIISKNLLGHVSEYFYYSLAMVIFGAVLVLILAPKSKPKPAPVPAPAS